MQSPAETPRPLGVEQSIFFKVVNVDMQGSGAIAVIELEPVEGSVAPDWQAGAHIDVLLPNGLERQYSLCGTVGEQRWRIGVLREPESRGGSQWIHDNVKVGDELKLQGPRNNFQLVDAPVYQFIAGGIGITPLLPMIREVEARGGEWRLLYGGRSVSSMAFLDELEPYGDRVTLWPQDEYGFIPIANLVAALEPGGVIYTCGPGPLLDAVEAAMPLERSDMLHLERFRADEKLLNQERTAFDIYLDYSELELHVPVDKTIVDVVTEAGVDVMTSCREGTCGTCETYLLEGIPDHRDSYLSAADKASNEMMMVCVSRAKTPRLVLDL